MIRIEKLSKIFKTSNEVHALRSVSANVEAGDIFGVIGMSGAGKSTLLRCIAQLEKPTSGSIFIEEKNITELSGKENIELRKRVGVIFQGYHLLMQRTVRDNIGFPLELSGVKKRRKKQKDR
ncbi:MAG: ATP-binding cassette domain-containing protein [Oscillospiraceae bacterium]|nr:ATP-binding cassette domain-containing protein [Oscillospiraceae bacterium]